MRPLPWRRLLSSGRRTIAFAPSSDCVVNKTCTELSGLPDFQAEQSWTRYPMSATVALIAGQYAGASSSNCVALCTQFSTGRVRRIWLYIAEPAGAGHTRSFGLRSTSSTDYTLPRLRTKFSERTFSYAGPSAWNELTAWRFGRRGRPSWIPKTAENSLFTAAHNVYWHLSSRILPFMF